MADIFHSHLDALRTNIELLREQRDRYHAAVVEGDREIRELKLEVLQLRKQIRAGMERWQNYEERADGPTSQAEWAASHIGPGDPDACQPLNPMWRT